MSYFRALLNLGALVVAITSFVPNAAAFEVYCWVKAEAGVQCTPGPQSARRAWDGPHNEHKALFELAAEALEAEEGVVIPTHLDLEVFVGEGIAHDTKEPCSLSENATAEDVWDAIVELEFGEAVETAADAAYGVYADLWYGNCEVGRCEPDEDTGTEVLGTCILDLQAVAPAPFGEVLGTAVRRRALSEFAGMPDMVFSLWDWASGAELCPLAVFGAPFDELDAADCHSFQGHLGFLNSSHFLPQAQYFYAWYHRLAVERAAACDDLRQRLGSQAERLSHFVDSCEAQAFVLEAVGQHFLQDAWSAGHMWERWGSTSPQPFDGDLVREGIVAATAGLLHGSERLLGKEDALCSPAEQVRFVGEGAGGKGQQMLGDFHAHKMTEGDERFAHQLQSLLECSKRGMLEVWDASRGAAPPQKPVSSDEACFGQRATNLAILRGAGQDFRTSLGTVVVGFDPLLVGKLLPAGLRLGLLGDASDISLVDHPLTAEYRLDLLRLSVRINLEAAFNPHGTELATGGLPPILGIAPNGEYVDVALGERIGETSDPPLPWLPAPDDSEGSPAHLLAKTFHRAHAKEWCSAFEDEGEYRLDALAERARSGPEEARSGACGLCIEMASRHLRIGTGPDDYLDDPAHQPLCHFLAEAPEPSRFIYQPESCAGAESRQSLAARWCGCSLADALGWGQGGSTTGDPHIKTLDGVGYDLQAPGDFVLARATDPDAPFEVHVRHEPHQGKCPSVSFNTGVATRVGNARVSAYGEDRSVRINGSPIDLEVGERHEFADCSHLERVSERTWVLLWSSGAGLRFDLGAHIDLELVLPKARRGAVEGLLGDFDGSPEDDLKLPGGAPLEDPDWETIHGPFAAAWRVAAGQSLLSDLPIPEVPFDASTPVQIPAAEAESALQTCLDAGVSDPVLQAWCALDVACTGDDSLAAAFADQTPPVHAYGVPGVGELDLPEVAPSELCDTYCALMAEHCPETDLGGSTSNCQLWCAFMDTGLGQPGVLSGNNPWCRLGHAQLAAAGDADACRPADMSGHYACTDLSPGCQELCHKVEQGCPVYEDPGSCVFWCEIFEDSGQPGDTSGHTLQCRLTWADQLGEHPDACLAVGPQENYLCTDASDACVEFCQLVSPVCAIEETQGAQGAFTNASYCLTLCPEWETSGQPGDTSGDTLQCRMTYAELAQEDPDAWCMATSPLSDQCTDPP